MRPGLRLMLMRSGGEQRQDGYSGGYRQGPEERFRDRRGRKHYDNGRFAPTDDGRMGDMDGMDGYRYGGSMRYDSPAREEYPMTPYYPHMYQGYPPMEDRPRSMHKIGFSIGGEMEKLPVEHGRGGYGMQEMSYSRGGDGGYNAIQGPLSKEMATEWVTHMHNEDGTVGPHWTIEKTEEARNQRGIDCNPLMFWVAMNMIYSDYCKVAQKINANSMDFYAYMAKAFLDDKDALPHKLARYYTAIVEK